MPEGVILGVDFRDLKYFPPSEDEYFTADTAGCISDEHWWQLLTHICHHYVNCHLPEMGTVRIKSRGAQLNISHWAGLGWASAELDHQDHLVIDAASSSCGWLSDRVGAPCLGILHALLLVLCSQMNIQQQRPKADDLNCFQHCHWPWWPLYHVHCVRQCYIWEKRWMTWLLLFQQYNSETLQINNESILWPEDKESNDWPETGQ